MNESNVIKMRNPFEGDSMDLKIFTGSKANTSFRKHLVIEKYETHLSKKKQKRTEATTAANNYKRNREIEKVLFLGNREGLIKKTLMYNS